MTKLSEVMDLDALAAQIEAGYIREKAHPSLPLMLLNYSEKVQYERAWTPETIASRGLIYNTDTMEIVARGFNKFWNWDDSTQPYPPAGAMVMSTKFDGSLGILYLDEDGQYKIATRGSFASDQAHKATEILENYYWNVLTDEEVEAITAYFSMNDATFLFEIIYPQNRIVVDYGKDERLVLLDVIDNKTGKSLMDFFDSIPWPDKAEKRLVPGGFSVDISHEIPQGEEGFVLYWPHTGFRCKMKSSEYVELHRMVTGLSEKTLWEALGAGTSTEQIKDGIPDELHEWVDRKAAAMYAKAAEMLDQAQDDFDHVLFQTLEALDYDKNHPKFRATFARYAASYPASRAYLFKTLDGADSEVLWSMAWKTVRPVGDTRAWNNMEETE
jgi:RNA ligase